MLVYPRLKSVKAPALPTPPAEYRGAAFGDHNNVLRLYFNQLDGLLTRLTELVNTYEVYTSDTNTYTGIGPTAYVTVADTDYVPLVTVKLATGSTAVIVPYMAPFQTDSADVFTVSLIKNGTLTGASYDTTTLTDIDFDLSATVITGGTVVMSMTVVNHLHGHLLGRPDLSLTLVDGDTYTLAAKVASGTGTITGGIELMTLVT